MNIMNMANVCVFIWHEAG